MTPSKLFDIEEQAYEYEPPSSYEMRIDAGDYDWRPDDTQSDSIDIPMLPFQIEAMNDTTSKVLGIVAGYGA